MKEVENENSDSDSKNGRVSLNAVKNRVVKLKESDRSSDNEFKDKNDKSN